MGKDASLLSAETVNYLAKMEKIKPSAVTRENVDEGIKILGEEIVKIDDVDRAFLKPQDFTKMRECLRKLRIREEAAYSRSYYSSSKDRHQENSLKIEGLIDDLTDLSSRFRSGAAEKRTNDRIDRIQEQNREIQQHLAVGLSSVEESLMDLNHFTMTKLNQVEENIDSTQSQEYEKEFIRGSAQIDVGRYVGSLQLYCLQLKNGVEKMKELHSFVSNKNPALIKAIAEAEFILKQYQAQLNANTLTMEELTEMTSNIKKLHQTLNEAKTPVFEEIEAYKIEKTGAVVIDYQRNIVPEQIQSDMGSIEKITKKDLEKAKEATSTRMDAKAKMHNRIVTGYEQQKQKSKDERKKFSSEGKTRVEDNVKEPLTKKKKLDN
ncbi:MAG: hypothetical protein BGO43_00375 [Gammaproteobacteria bacterium 39-13]|nr:hypothetical protein [Gammaproteobacteria bacterium]OJV96715.1 MAG: hypothetical protein BGO43_00375 [Gammaproteobacteria bacterium 39-13]